MILQDASLIHDWSNIPVARVRRQFRFEGYIWGSDAKHMTCATHRHSKSQSPRHLQITTMEVLTVSGTSATA